MDNNRDGDQRVKRVGKPVRMLNDSDASSVLTGEDLHLCPECGSMMVQPLEATPVEANCWWVDRRCPECSWEGGGIYPQRVLDRFDEILDDGTDALLQDLAKLQRTNMEEELAQFTAALNAGQILPEDF